MVTVVQIIILIMAIIAALMGFGMDDTNKSIVCAVLSMFLFALLVMWIGGFWR